MVLTLCPAGLKDASAISQLIIPLARQYICPTCEASIETLLLESMSEHNIALNLEGECCYHMALDKSGKLLGVIGMRQETHLFHLFVADGYQGQGIARQLWHYVKSDTLNRLGGLSLRLTLRLMLSRFTANLALSALAVSDSVVGWSTCPCCCQHPKPRVQPYRLTLTSVDSTIVEFE
ncbi:GNAT family N-acetyltransferase [Vibrio ostreicida]|uniref:GNAT family N-acetyltransferase n=1 Tax=Vibrio ostreicida TaxID=526588 RepID=A0ABT8BXC2_9VIBR|nr:GNAT family N-acetyltransferase [Vibrio ostreicida]MDN3611658.1 GNAT family N-acetyltransferase [Vibrio ostreicida]